MLSSADELRAVLWGKTKGYLAEVITTIDNAQQIGKGGIIFTFNVPCMSERDLTVVTCGRYFKTNHPKYPVHQLSNRIVRSKHNDDQANIFADLLLLAAKWISEFGGRVDGITRVPPRPSEKRDRLASIVKLLCKNTGWENALEVLECVADFPTQKGLGREDRLVNVKGKYKARAKGISGKHIVVIDDIFTTEATITECARMLLLAGAAKVTALVITVNQMEPSWFMGKELPCPDSNCNGFMRLRFNRDGRSAFFGCSNYPNCRETMNFSKGWIAFNRLNTKAALTYWNDNIIDDIEF